MSIAEFNELIKERNLESIECLLKKLLEKYEVYFFYLFFIMSFFFFIIF